MPQKLILRGLLAGGLGGLVAFLFARVFAEPMIGKAIAYEAGRDDALAELAGTPPDMGADVFSRTVQSNVGIGVGMVFFGLAVGGIFAVVYSVAYGRVGLVRARTLALVSALLAFGALYLVPFLKYPANPPAIGDPDTIGARTALYLTMIASSVVLTGVAYWAGRRLRPRLGTYGATLASVAIFAVLIGVVMYLLPSLGHLRVDEQEYGVHKTETPQPLYDASGRLVYPGFPADVLFSFRLYSVCAQGLLWTTIGLVFAPLAERLLEPGRRVRAAATSKVSTPA